ncbi:MAG: ATP-binding cassette domain-containing protein [Trueperaceae bacterium]|nr:ATP-binding cassette domain-containing protein [Trueperaceae bacterium]
MSLLQVENLTKRFGGLVAVNEISFGAEAGEILAIIGPNGAGKTTILNMLSGLLPVSGGHIYLAGRDITRDLPAARCHLGLGRAFQVVQPFPEMTVAENVSVGALFGTAQTSQQQAEALTEEVLELTQLAHLRDTPAESLTLMQEKRLEIARALATRPKILLLDEVMAGLRPAESRQAVTLIETIRRSGVTVIFIEHVMPVVRDLADRVVVVDYGTKIAEGSYYDVTRNPQVIEAYLGSSDDEDPAEDSVEDLAENPDDAARDAEPDADARTNSTDTNSVDTNSVDTNSADNDDSSSREPSRHTSPGQEDVR